MERKDNRTTFYVHLTFAHYNELIVGELYECLADKKF